MGNDSFKNYSNLSVEETVILASFDSYLQSKREKKLYNADDTLPQKLILLYYLSDTEKNFDNIVDNFKRKYVYNENELEDVHNAQERKGLGVIYDYIRDRKYETFPNIHVILKLHSLLYSKVAHPEYGGNFRKCSACISGSDVKTTSPEDISKEIGKLSSVYTDLLDLSEIINTQKRNDLLIEYINRCIDLKCRLIEIHPFADGNGRVGRALLNLLFRSVGLPPVYVKAKEKDEYIKAMDKAIRENDKQFVYRFYYYKVCDSIVELDIKEKLSDNKNNSQSENQGLTLK